MSRPTEPGTAGIDRAGQDNPLLDHFMREVGRSLEPPAELIARYGFAVPTDEALTCIGVHSPAGVVEVGAGTGYWARLLHERGIDTLAYDVAPAPSMENRWFGGSLPWHPVVRGDHSAVSRHADRTLLIIWPTRNEIWAAETIEAYYEAGGGHVVYVGEGPGGRTGDDVFHALLGELRTCAQCDYGATTSPCICGATPLWRRCRTVRLPHWPGCEDDLHVYERRESPSPDPRRPRWRRSEGRGVSRRSARPRS